LKKFGVINKLKFENKALAEQRDFLLFAFDEWAGAGWGSNHTRSNIMMAGG